MWLKQFIFVFLPITAVLFFDAYIIYDISLGYAKTARCDTVLKSLCLCGFAVFMLPTIQTVRYCYYCMYCGFGYGEFFASRPHRRLILYNIEGQCYHSLFR